jgi:hypothetical protein
MGRVHPDGRERSFIPNAGDTVGRRGVEVRTRPANEPQQQRVSSPRNVGLWLSRRTSQIMHGVFLTDLKLQLGLYLHGKRLLSVFGWHVSLSKSRPNSKPKLEKETVLMKAAACVMSIGLMNISAARLR